MKSQMCTNMDPLAPTTSTLSPAIAHIAETAKSLAGSLLPDGVSEDSSATLRQAEEDRATKTKQKETVMWVLRAPERLQMLLADGEKEKAETDWAEIQNLLEKWRGVKGVTELTNRCTKIMQEKHGDDDT